MESKRQTNTTGLKVSFIPATNTKGNRFRLTQTNNKKSIVINGDINLDLIYFMELILSQIEEINTFNLVVDNTQNKYHLFSIDFKGNSFVDILHNFKKY